MSKKEKKHISHFVPRHITDPIIDEIGYDEETTNKILSIIDSDINTSETTAKFNLSTNRKHENQIQRHFNGELEWENMTPGAQRRFHEQARAFDDMREHLLEEVPESTELIERLEELYGSGWEDEN